VADGFAPSEGLRSRFIKRVSLLKQGRTSFESHWRELAAHMAPRRGRWSLSGTNQGDKRHQSIIDGTPRFSARVLASGMMAGLTSPARPWFQLTTPDPDLAEFAAVKEWLHTVTQRMRDVFAKSNFYKAAPVVYGELGVFGTGCALGLEDDQTLIRWYPQTVGSYWLAQSERLQVDTVYREMRWTVRQVVAKFGLDNVSDRVRTAYQRGDGENVCDVVHFIEPNDSHVLGRLGPRGKPIRSCWYELDSTEDRVLAEGGYYSTPLLAPRWEIAGEDIYGSSPGMDALGDAKSLQFQQKRKAQAIDKMVDPPLTGPTALRNQRISLLPGDVTYVDVNQVGAGLKSIYDVSLNPSMLLEDTQEIQKRIETAFFADLFLMLAMSDRREITAREVEERHEEKLLMLGPVLEQLNDEFLDPAIDRTFDVMLRGGLIPPPPRELEGVDLKVEYISILAQAQKRVALGAIDRLTGFVGNLAALKQDPSVFDKLDIDQAIDEYALACGTAPSIVRPDDEVEAVREGRAQAQQAAQMAQMAQPAAQLAGAAAQLGSTKSDPDSLLATLTGAVSGAP
jgi:hypothetical protein